MLDDYLRRRGVRDKVEIVYTYRPPRSCCATACSCSARPARCCPASSNRRASASSVASRCRGSIRNGASRTRRRRRTALRHPHGHAADTRRGRSAGVGRVAGREQRGLAADRPRDLKVYGLENVYVIGDTVDLPVSKAGGSCHNQAPVIANNIAGEIRLGQVCSAYDGRVRRWPRWPERRHAALVRLHPRRAARRPPSSAACCATASIAACTGPSQGML